MMPMIRTALLLSLALGACNRATDDSKGNAESSATVVKAKATFDSRSLEDLARAIKAVEKGDPDDADQGYDDVVSSFEGKRYEWTMFLVPALCSESQCNAMPFKDGGRDNGIVAGWMPRLKLRPSQRMRLLKQCGSEPQCPFTVRATLESLTASTEKFTSVSMSDVELMRAGG